LRFPGFQDNWTDTDLGSILKIGNGKDYKHLSEGDIPVFGTGGYMTSVNDFLYDGESVCIGRKGTINKPFYFNGKFWTVDTLFYTHSYKNVFPKFLFYVFEQINWLKYNEASGVPSLSKSTIEDIVVSIPNFLEQEKIAKFLSLLDDRISTQMKIIEKMESLIKGLCKFYHSLAEKTEYSVADLGIHFGTMNLAKEDLSESGKECILYGELFTKYHCVIDKIESFTKCESFEKSLSKGNDILFPASTTVDSLSLISPSALSIKDVILGGDMFGIHLHKKFNNEYVSYVMNYIYKKDLAKYAQGSTIIHLYYNNIKNVKILLPSLTEQVFLTDLMRLLRSKISNEYNILSAYQKQKVFFLNQMFI